MRASSFEACAVEIINYYYYYYRQTHREADRQTEGDREYRKRFVISPQ